MIFNSKQLILESIFHNVGTITDASAGDGAHLWEDPNNTPPVITDDWWFSAMPETDHMTFDRLDETGAPPVREAGFEYTPSTFSYGKVFYGDITSNCDISKFHENNTDYKLDTFSLCFSGAFPHRSGTGKKALAVVYVKNECFKMRESFLLIEWRIYLKAVSLTEGLVGYWIFDSETNDACEDYSPNDNLCQMVGNYNLITNNPIFDNAIEFNGNVANYAVLNNFYDINSPDGLFLGTPPSTETHFNNNCSYCAWVKVNSLTGDSYVFVDQEVNEGFINIKPTEVTARFFSTLTVTETIDLNDGEWHFLVFTNKKTLDLAEYEFKFFIDGTQVGSTISKTGSQSYDGPNGSLRLGYGFDGKIAHTRLYTRVLTEEEIEFLYNRKL